jgi:hypothetical protein
MYTGYTPVLRSVCSLHLAAMSEFGKNSNTTMPLKKDLTYVRGGVGGRSPPPLCNLVLHFSSLGLIAASSLSSPEAATVLLGVGVEAFRLPSLVIRGWATLEILTIFARVSELRLGIVPIAKDDGGATRARDCGCEVRCREGKVGFVFINSIG